MAAKPLPDVETLRKLLDYDPETGFFTWKPRPVDMFSKPMIQKSWNTRFAGKRAFPTTNSDGYHQGSVDGPLLKAHRIAWAMYHGSWPEGQIDHINGDRTDNRIVNLRDIPPLENHKNRKLAKNNPSGIIGVYWRKEQNCWMAKIGLNNKIVHLGYFANLSDAIEARKKAERMLGFHPNHGRS